MEFGPTTSNLEAQPARSLRQTGHNESFREKLLNYLMNDMANSTDPVKVHFANWAIPFFYPYKGMEGKFPGGVPEILSKGVRN